MCPEQEEPKVYTLLQSQTIRGAAGKPLPNPFRALSDKGTEFLRGQLSLICAGPGTGKSLFALTLAIRSKVPTLYISADSDAFTQLSRAVSINTGWPLEDSARLVLSDGLDGVTEQLAQSPIRFVYDGSPTLEVIDRNMLAYEETYGDFPDLVIVDNISDCSVEGSADDAHTGLEALASYLHTMARESGAHVSALHHVTGPYNDANKPIPLSGVKGQIGRTPEMILTMFKPTNEFGDPDRLCVSTVKNRGGKADASGLDFAELEWLGDTATIRDIHR
ncbi:AAA family ATPase [Nocardia sp. IFM 10818]